MSWEVNRRHLVPPRPAQTRPPPRDDGVAHRRMMGHIPLPLSASLSPVVLPKYGKLPSTSRRPSPCPPIRPIFTVGLADPSQPMAQRWCAVWLGGNVRTRAASPWDSHALTGWLPCSQKTIDDVPPDFRGLKVWVFKYYSRCGGQNKRSKGEVWLVCTGYFPIWNPLFPGKFISGSLVDVGGCLYFLSFYTSLVLHYIHEALFDILSHIFSELYTTHLSNPWVPSTRWIENQETIQ